MRFSRILWTWSNVQPNEGRAFGVFEANGSQSNRARLGASRERKRMSKELRRFYGKAFGASLEPGIPTKHSQTDRRGVHNMLVFHKGASINWNSKVSHMTAENHMLELLASLWKEDPDESISVSERPGLKFAVGLLCPNMWMAAKGMPWSGNSPSAGERCGECRKFGCVVRTGGRWTT